MATNRLSPEELEAYLSERISGSEWRPGHKLPTERALSEQYGLARNTVRRVLDRLVEQGRIVRHVGRGTFVAGRSTPADGIANLAEVDVSPAEVMELRLIIEPSSVELAVVRATPSDLEFLEQCLVRSEKARTWQEFEKWDAALHARLVRATRNHMLELIFSAIDRVRERGEWGKLKQASLTTERRAAYQREHRKIVEAIRRRDAETAKRHVTEHLLHVRRNLIGY
ncbi:MAG: FCD domain-containing protein [Ectothiorhodospiraceae bacterium]